MTYLKGQLSFPKDTHRLYEAVYTLVIASSSMSISLAVLQNQQPPHDPQDNIALDSLLFPLVVKLHASAFAFRLALTGIKPDIINVGINDRGPNLPFTNNPTSGFK